MEYVTRRLDKEDYGKERESRGYKGNVSEDAQAFFAVVTSAFIERLYLLQKEKKLGRFFAYCETVKRQQRRGRGNIGYQRGAEWMYDIAE
jgi:hypothetical protein